MGRVRFLSLAVSGEPLRYRFTLVTNVRCRAGRTMAEACRSALLAREFDRGSTRIACAEEVSRLGECTGYPRCSHRNGLPSSGWNQFSRTALGCVAAGQRYGYRSAIGSVGCRRLLKRNSIMLSTIDSTRRPWNYGRLIGPKPPFKPQHTPDLRAQLATSASRRMG